MAGIILRRGTEEEIGESGIGEMSYITETDEYLSDGMKRPNVLGDVLDYEVLVSDGAPTSGDGMMTIQIPPQDSHREWLNIDGNWVLRDEGYMREELLVLYDEIKPKPSLAIRRDGTTNIPYPPVDLALATKLFVDSLEVASTELSVRLDGQEKMSMSYSPTRDQDVIDMKSLWTGKIHLRPPTTQPNHVGAVWNDNGILRIKEEDIT